MRSSIAPWWAVSYLTPRPQATLPLLPIGLLNLVKHSPLVKVRLLRLLPAAEHLIYGKQGNRRKDRGVFLPDRFQPRPVVMLRRDLLALRRIQVFEVGLCDGLGPVPAHHFIHPCYRRLSQDAQRRCDQLEFALA